MKFRIHFTKDNIELAIDMIRTKINASSHVDLKYKTILIGKVINFNPQADMRIAA